MAGYFPDTPHSFITIHGINTVKKTVHLYTEYEFMLCNKGYTSEYNKPSVTAPHSANKT